VYSADLRKHYDLKDPAWRYDIMPEIIDGHNVADFIDPDIDAKLAELEREEEQLEAQHQAEVRAKVLWVVVGPVGVLGKSSWRRSTRLR
jgi:nucleolar GTP-binding protein